MIEWLYIVLGVLSALYLYFTWHNYYWRKKGVAQINPLPLIGNLKDALLLKKSIFYICMENYEKFPEEDAVGFYIMTKPALMIRTPELVQQVLVKDFSSFHDNFAVLDEKVDPYTYRDLFFTPGAHWKIYRTALVAGLNVSKIKAIFPQMKELFKQLEEHVDNNLSSEIEVKNLTFLFTTDVISNCFFGISGNSFVQNDAVFKKMGDQMVQELNNPVKLFILMTFPKLAYFLKWTVMPKSVIQYLLDAITDTEEFRKKNNIDRNDFLQYCLNLRGKPIKTGSDEVFTDIDVAGFAMTIFMEGFETSSITATCALFELAHNLDIQEKARSEILSTATRLEDLDFEKLNKISYLDKIVSETLRKHPVTYNLMRLCTNRTTLEIGGKRVTIEEGTPVLVPLYNLHNNPKYYPEPNKFDPERFSEENIKSRPPYAHVPFGEGPRICTGMRFGLTQVKLILAGILLRYRVRSTEKTIKEMPVDKWSVLHICNEIWFKFEKIKE